MGYDVGANHVWGVLLAGFDTPLAEEVSAACEFADRLEAGCIDTEEAADWEAKPDSIEAKILARNLNDGGQGGRDPIKLHFGDRVRDVLASKGVELPDDADLHWTGSEDDRPGRCQVSANTVVVGYGMFRDPTKPITVPDSFRAVAEHFNWVWGG